MRALRAPSFRRITYSLIWNYVPHYERDGRVFSRALGKPLIPLERNSIVRSKRALQSGRKFGWRRGTLNARGWLGLWNKCCQKCQAWPIIPTCLSVIEVRMGLILRPGPQWERCERGNLTHSCRKQCPRWCSSALCGTFVPETIENCGSIIGSSPSLPSCARARVFYIHNRAQTRCVLLRRSAP